jgi:Fe-S-cluster containining protein
MGYVFSIIADRGEYAYTVRNQYLGDMTDVQVVPEMIPLFCDRGIFDRYPHACPFLRFNSDGKAFCTVHLTRPELCRIYGCWQLLIQDARGRRAGRVMQAGHISFDDDLLRHIWENHIRSLDRTDDQEWERNVIRILEKFGYTVIR